MRKYLIHFKGHGVVHDIDNATTTSEKWGEILRDFASENGGKGDYAEAISLYPDCVTPNGVAYDWELAGPGGASFRLHQWPNINKEQIDEAKRYLKRTQDVVRLVVLKLK